jgi:hypothetical protein
MKLLLPMVSHGPIGICSFCCRWPRMGPLEYAAAAADEFAWAHWHMQLLMPMASHRPIGICSCCCRWFRMGPLFPNRCCQCTRMGLFAYAATATDGFVWADYCSMMPRCTRALPWPHVFFKMCYQCAGMRQSHFQHQLPTCCTDTCISLLLATFIGKSELYRQRQ